MSPSETTTIATEGDPSSRRNRDTKEVLALCVASCASAPRHVGEIAIVPPDGRSLLLGRGDGDGAEPRLRFFRQRPGVLTPAGPLGGPSLSRRQLLLGGARGGVELENVGRAPIRINDVERQTGRLVPGDVLQIGRELVLLCVARPARLRPLRQATYPSGEFGEPDRCSLIGESPAIWRLRAAIAFAAAADAHVLLLGESGAGKELTAAAIHALSERAKRVLVSRNAATLPEGILDAELFGNIRNYPNPGMPERKGLIGEADGGTLFLDEIGELPPELVAHLLRVLDQKGEYQRLGASVTRRSNFRLIAATNRDPSALMSEFVMRLTLRVELPALTERREDIPLLARHLVLRARAKAPSIVAPFVFEAEGREEVRFDPRLIDHLLRRDYTGNVRELDAVLWHAIAESHGDSIELPDEVPNGRAKRPAPSSAASTVRKPEAEPTVEAVQKAMARSGGSITRAARELGLSSRYALYRLLRKYGIAHKRRG